MEELLKHISNPKSELETLRSKKGTVWGAFLRVYCMLKKMLCSKVLMQYTVQIDLYFKVASLGYNKS